MKYWDNIGVLGVVLLVFAAGCPIEQPQQDIQQAINPETTIGSVSRIHFFEAIPVRGIGIVAGLPGTGSSECPKEVREELEKYIWKQVPASGMINPRNFIESTNTAVVEIFGVIPSLATEKDTFDVAIRPLSSSQTTSLDGGHLYSAELKELGRLVRIQQFSKFSKTLATVEGPIYSNKLQTNEDGLWYVLGGARIIHTPRITLVLENPDFIVANAIRNRINERFGAKTAVPVSEGEIVIQIPDRYVSQKERYLQMIRSLQLGDNPSMKETRIRSLIQDFLANPGDESFEVALEAVGKPALNFLAEHLQHPDEAIRFRVSRCMLNIGDDRALSPLRKMLLDPASSFRTQAVEVIGQSAKPSDARAILMVALADTDFQVRLKAYEMLFFMRSPVIKRKIVAGDLVVDSVITPGPKIIYVYQQKTPRIVLFGAPVYCADNLFVQSDDGTVTINAKPGDKFLSVSRKHPHRPRVLGPISAGYEVSSLIETLGELSEVNNRLKSRPGLAVSYAEIIPMLKKMCEIDAIPAQFIAEPPIKLDPVLQNLPPIDR